jgi:hypothetical protein
VKLASFPSLELTMKQFRGEEFCGLGPRKKFKLVNKVLLQFIQETPSPCFLLAAVLEYISAVNKEKIFEEEYSLSSFEFWLNHFSALSFEEMLLVRGKIIGRFIPRDEYQVFFPVGSGKMFQGSHFVAAHLSPDVDSTVASFWGWSDAFGCRVSEGVHEWSLPTGLSDGHIKKFFQGLFGKEIFELLPRKLPTMTISALDLLTKNDFRKVSGSTRADTVDHTKDQIVVVVDDKGLYKGEWLSQDAEAVRQVISGFSQCLRWFESICQSAMIHVLAKEKATVEEVTLSYEKVLDSSIRECAAVQELPGKLKKLLSDYFKIVLLLPEGVDHSFKELLVQLDVIFASRFIEFFKRSYALSSPDLFDVSGILKADRVQAARAFESVVKGLKDAVAIVRHKIELLDHLLLIKEKVLDLPSMFVTLKSDVDEMRNKIGHQDHLTVVSPEGEDAWFPLGVVSSDDLKRNVLGTVSFRDFSSPEETKMASYIDIISIVDHHKSRVQTSSAATLLLGDAQSSNTLVAEKALFLNKKYATMDVCSHGYFVDKSRELAEYFSYLYGIIDDTDLLTRVSRRDVVCVKELLDRMRSLVDETSREAVSFAAVPNDHHFAKNVAEVLVRSKELHSIYTSVYKFRQQEVENALLAVLENKPSSLFLDTKEQNGCCRVGQAKLFAQNIPTFQTHKDSIQRLWQAQAKAVFQVRQHIDLFIQMLTTVPGEQEVFAGEENLWKHKDELWIWTPEGGVPEQHLIWFLNNFQMSSSVKQLDIEVELVGPHADARLLTFKQNFSIAKQIKVTLRQEGPLIAIMRFKAGAINSRKAQISPCLPKLLP